MSNSGIYAKLQDGIVADFPVDSISIINAHPDESWGVPLDLDEIAVVGYVPVIVQALPTGQTDKRYLRKSAPTLVGLEWVWGYEEVAATAADILVAQANKNQVIDINRADHVDNDFSYEGCPFDSDDTSTMNVIGSAVLSLIKERLGQTWDPTFRWRDKENHDHLFEEGTDFFYFAEALFTHRQLSYFSAWSKKSELQTIINEGASLQDILDFNAELL